MSGKKTTDGSIVNTMKMVLDGGGGGGGGKKDSYLRCKKMENSSNGFDRRSKQRFMIVSGKRVTICHRRANSNNWKEDGETRILFLVFLTLTLKPKLEFFVVSKQEEKFDQRRRGEEIEIVIVDPWRRPSPDMRSCIKDDIEPINRSGPERESRSAT